MKTLFGILLAVLPVLLSGCDGSNQNGGLGRPPIGYDAAKIYDYDLLKCYCCSGYMITIKGKNYKFADEDVSGSNPLNVMDTKYPMDVYLKWSVKPGDCPDRIVVEKLQIVKGR